MDDDVFRLLFEESSRGLLISSADGQIEQVNGTACAITGLTAAQLVGTHISAIPLEMKVRPISNGKLLHTVRDIAHRRENDLLHQQRQVVEASPNPLAMTDLSGLVTYANPSFLRLWGYTDTSEVNGRPASEFAESAHEVIALIVASRGLWTGEVECIRKQGDRFFARLSTSVTRNATGKPTGMIGAFTDITELRATAEARQVAEQTLALREDQLAQVVSVSQIGVFDHDQQTDVIYWSPVARRLFGWDPQHPITLPMFVERIFPDDRDAVLRAVQAAHDPSSDGTFDAKFRIIHDDGTIRWMESHARTFFRDGVPYRTVGGSRDVTASHKAEEERVNLLDRLTQAEKMESVGRLAGGIAHDFNNMLAVILGYIELAITDLPDDHPVQEDLIEVQGAAQRSADLTRQLLAFARRQSIAPSVQCLDDTVTSLLKMLHRLIGEDITLAWHPSGTSWMVNVDSTQVDQVLTNLTVNARDAVGGIGQVTIRTENIVADARFVSTHRDAAPGEYVMLAVSDTGHGMDEETVAHIFEPFFTTKAPGQGTGLGLAMVYGIARQNNGFVTVESKLEAGTTVAIYLPRHTAVPVLTPASAAAAVTIGGQETILVVEDEPQVLLLTSRLLRGFGYQVLTANTPTDALRLVESYTGMIHLAVLDLVMPELNGAELYQRLCALRPGLSCMFVSGYPAQVSSNRGVLVKGTPYLQKPFAAADLARTVRESLDRPFMHTPVIPVRIVN